MHNLSIVCFEKSGGPLTKRISLTATGEVKSDGSACTMPEGIARRVCFQDIAEFGEFIGRLASNQAIALGSLRSDLPDQVKVITKRRMNGQTRPRHHSADKQQHRVLARHTGTRAARLRREGHAARGRRQAEPGRRILACAPVDDARPGRRGQSHQAIDERGPRSR